MTTPRGGQHHRPATGAATARTAGPGSLRSWGDPTERWSPSRLVADGNQRSDGAALSPEETGEYTHAQILTILTGLLLGMFLAALDQTIVSTSIRTIADDLDGLSVQAWVTTSYLITSTITTPIYGKLGDLYGRKKLFMFAISVFIVGSVPCAFATSMYELAAFRAFQGIGAGGLFTLVLAIIGDIVSPRERARYTGYFMATFATSSVLGPVIGGFFAGQETILGVTGWRWVFLVNVPVGIAALIVVFRTLHLRHTPRLVRIDWWGAVALVVALVPLLTVAEQGREWGWGSAARHGRTSSAGSARRVLPRRARDGRRCPDPAAAVPASARSTITILASVPIGAAMFGGILILPLYMQIVHGASPTRAGLLMLPMVLGMMTGAMVSGKSSPGPGGSVSSRGSARRSWRRPPRCSRLPRADTIAAGHRPVHARARRRARQLHAAAADHHAERRTTDRDRRRHQLGDVLPPDRRHAGRGGVPVDPLQHRRRPHRRRVQKAAQTPAFQAVVANPTPADAAILNGGPAAAAQVQNDSSFIETLSPALAHPFKQGFASSMDLVFLMGAGVGLIAFLLLLFMPKVELRATSAAAAARAEAGAAPAAPMDQEA